MNIISQNYNVKDIPITTFHKEGNVNSPIIFIAHGLNNDKHEGYELAHRLAEKDFIAVCVDAYMHGERTLNNEELEGYNVNYKLFEIIERTSNDINVLIDCFEGNPLVDITKIGMTGFSMGALITYHLIATQPKINVAVPIIGLPAFCEYWCYFIENINRKMPDWLDEIKGNDNKEWRDYLSDLDPFYKIYKFAPKPLLMINGKLDESVPLFFTEKLYDRILSKYKDNEQKLKLSLHNSNHQVTNDMLVETVSWFLKYLK